MTILLVFPSATGCIIIIIIFFRHEPVLLLQSRARSSESNTSVLALYYRVVRAADQFTRKVGGDRGILLKSIFLPPAVIFLPRHAIFPGNI